MSNRRATITCGACGYAETFDRLGAAREALDDHERDTGHEATWEIHGVSAGVERAGEDAGVCGRPECTNAESPLYRDDV